MMIWRELTANMQENLGIWDVVFVNTNCLYFYVSLAGEKDMKIRVDIFTIIIVIGWVGMSYGYLTRDENVKESTEKDDHPSCQSLDWKEVSCQVDNRRA